MKLAGIIRRIVVGIIVLTFAVPITEAFATTGAVMSVSPMNVRIILEPGETYEGVVKVTNTITSTSEIDYEASVGSFSQRNSDSDAMSEDISYDEISSYNQMMEWITFKDPKGHLGIGETRELTYYINVPIDAPAGGQYATIMIEDVTPQAEVTGNGLMIQDGIRIAYIIYAEVTGTTVRDGAILENNIPAFLLNNTLEATSVVRNDGNVHTDAEYILQVWPIFSDEEICTNEESAAKSFVMPGVEKYHTETCNLPLVGVFRAKQTVKIFDEMSEVERMIIVCPIWLLFLVIFAIIAIIIWLIMHAVQGKNHKRAKSIEQ